MYLYVLVCTDNDVRYVSNSLHITTCITITRVLHSSIDYGSPDFKFAHDTMVACGDKIVEGLSREPKELALSLHAKGIIADDTFQETNELNETKREKARRLYTAALEVVKTYPHRFADFVAVFQKNQLLYFDLLKALEETYKRIGEQVYRYTYIYT